MSTTASTTTRFEREIVTLFRPQILVALSFGPATGASTTLQVGEYGLLPGVETLAMHKLTDRATIVVTSYLDRVM